MSRWRVRRLGDAEPFRVEVAPSQHVTAIDYPAAMGNRSGVTLILGHGAGADQTSGFMVAFATALAERGIDVVTFNFPYTEQRRRIPDPSGRLEACYRAVIETVRGRITDGRAYRIAGCRRRHRQGHPRGTLPDPRAA